MNREMPAGNIFIYCDDPRHAKRVAVTNFYPIGDGQWAEVAASTASGRPAAPMLFGDDVPKPGHSIGGVRLVDVRRSRKRYRFECRKCRRSAPATEKKLYAVLNAFAANGASDISLSVLAASLTRIE